MRGRLLPGLARVAQFWRSPADQPALARPALLLVAGLAGLAYAWGSNNANLEPFYGAAARSMSLSWHDFLFGAFDPAGTVTVDKLPGALWVQALSLRLLGFHVWALVLPQEALAHLCDMHSVEVGRAERGVRDVRISTVAKLARGLEIPACKLLDGVEWQG